MRTLILLFFTCLLGINLNAQEAESKLDIRFGIGASLLGTGDMRAIMFENEINYELNKLFAVGGGFAFGKSDNGVYNQSAYYQVNTNIYLSPFNNQGRNDFRIGTGLTWYNVSDSYGYGYLESSLLPYEYTHSPRHSLGYNLIIENTYSVTDRFLLGAKIFSQPYFNGDINSGALLKVGVRL